MATETYIYTSDGWELISGEDGQDGDAGDLIDDNRTLFSKTWSSQKIASELHEEKHNLNSHIDVQLGGSPELKEGQGIWYDADTGQWRNRSAFEESWPTGLGFGGELNIVTGEIEVIEGTGVVVDSYTDPASPPMAKTVSWLTQQEPITAAPAAAGSLVWFSIAATTTLTGDVGGVPAYEGELKQYGVPPNPSLSRAEVFLGVAIHNGVEWKEISNPKVINQSVETLREYLVNVTGPSHIISGGAVSQQALFTLNQAEATIWENNRNWHNDKSNPNREILPASTPIVFQYVNRDFTDVGAQGSTVDPATWDDGGVVSPIAGSSANTTIQRLYIDPANNYWMLYGQTVYPNFLTAQANLYADNPVVPFILQNSILLGFVIAEKGKIDWDVDEAVFIQPGAGGNTAGAGAPITNHDDLNGITPDNHHNQVHLLYGPDHSDVDTATPLAKEHILAWDGVDSFDPDYRTKAIQYSTGITAYPQQMVFEDGWLMVANKETTDYPAPQPVGDPTFALPDVPLFQEFSNESVVDSGHLYTFTVSGYYRGLRVWVPETGPDITYRIIAVRNPNSTNPTYTVITDPILDVDGWTTLSVDTVLVLAGEEFLVYIEALNSGGSVSPGGTPADWIRETSSNTADPLDGNWNTNIQESILRINEVDADGNPAINFLGVIPGSTFEFVSTVDPTVSVTYTAISAETYDPVSGSYEWTVSVTSTGAGGAPQPTDRTVGTIIVPVAAATKFVGIPAYWNPTTLPTWATITSNLQYDGVDQPVVGDEAYGIDVLFQELTTSDDWDIYGLPSGGGGGGGGGALVAVETRITDLENQLAALVTVAQSNGWAI